MSASNASKGCLRLPEWIRVKLPRDANFCRTRGLVRSQGLHTVCQSARCPNIFECFSKNTATFLILGDRCTRSCAFCNISPADPDRLAPPDPNEPQSLANTAKELGLDYVVTTSVTRDDLPDGGAAHFAMVVAAIRQTLPHAGVELLIPDFKGDQNALNTVLAAKPDVLNHNVETAPRLYPAVRPQADYRRSLKLLSRTARAKTTAKSGLMVGLGEDDREVRTVLKDLVETGCSIITIGQYLRPSLKHPPVERYVHPDIFREYEEYGRSLGANHVFSGPLVRSSYHAADFARRRRDG